MTVSNKVFCLTGDGKIAIFEEIIEQSCFFDDIEECFLNSGKEKKAFKIAIKPNFMVFLTKNDPSNYTDSELVEYLVKGLLNRGFMDINIVESQNVLGQWYFNRDVATVAGYCGYSGNGYRIVDLTLDAVPYNFGGKLGDHFVGSTWKEADYRISFAKNKTHPANKYTLAVKNIFGVTTCANKYYEYHKLIGWEAATIEMLNAFPVHFGFIDAFISADGAFGFRGEKNFKDTKTILAAKDIISLDWAGARKMGLDPLESILMQQITDLRGKPEYELVGPDEQYADWNNTPFLLDTFDHTIEKVFTVHSFLTHLIMYAPDPVFKEKDKDFFETTRVILGL